VSALTDQSGRLQSSLNEARLETQIFIGIYEECLSQLYPAQCIAEARPSADAFLAELYPDTP
jgi:hypothetical protein